MADGLLERSVKALVITLATSILLISCGRTGEKEPEPTENVLRFMNEDRTDGTPIVPKGVRFNCTPTSVWDGDGPIWCEEGPRVRLAGIAAREIDGSCQKNQPCPNVSGLAARDKLADLIGEVTGMSPDGHLLVVGPTMACTSEGSARGKRTAAWCMSPKSGDISCELIASGEAVAWDRYWRGHKC